MHILIIYLKLLAWVCYFGMLVVMAMPAKLFLSSTRKEEKINAAITYR